MSAVTYPLTDAWTITRRGLAHWARRPGALAVSLAFPVLMLVMFAYFLGGGMALGGADYRQFLVPGVFVLSMAFGLETTMVALTRDLERGVVDRFRSLPMAPSAVLAGRSAVDMLESVLGLGVLVAAGLAMGWRPSASVGGALAAVGLLLLLRFALLWAGIYGALVAGRPDMVQAVQILVWPLAFLSSAFTSPGTMPGWMGTIAEWNPLSATGTAVRELFGNPTWPGGADGSWALDHAVLLAVAWPLLVLVVAVPLALRRWASLSR